MSREGSKKLALITGGNAGIGLETCRGLLQAGFHVILTARSQSKANAAIDNLLATAPAGIPRKRSFWIWGHLIPFAERRIRFLNQSEHCRCVYSMRALWPYHGTELWMALSNSGK